MAETVFRMTSFTLRHLVDNIKRGDIALPELQRPFVWSNSKARDLFDSMYRGFPVGYLLFWATGAELGARQIGTEKKDAHVARWLIVDGQQRLTSLYSVMTSEEVVREDYSTSRIQIAFRPKDGHFSVWDASVDRNPEYLKDISKLWQSFRPTLTKFFEDHEKARGPLEPDVRTRWEDALDRVRDLQNFPFNVVELDQDVDEEQVAEVFVRINSEGVKLNQADFILTLMSVFWDEGRKDLESFSREATRPSLSGPSPFNWYITPAPDQLLRVAIALAFDRAVLRHAYSILRGKDLDSGHTSTERRDQQFEALRAAQSQVLNLTNWHEYLKCLERAGYRGSKMISSQNVVLYTYAIWLRGRVKYGVPIHQLKEAVARWFFMAHLTARYSGSFETQAERDFAQIDELAGRIGFVGALDQIVDDVLTSDLWTITLPNDLATAASRSPALFAYFAALNILDADVLLSSGKVRERLDPAVTSSKGIERHHLFPRAYLRDELGIKDNKQINQIANMALVDWNDNIAISAKAPSEYWPSELSKKSYLSPASRADQDRWHALPENWTSLEFSDFLTKRRRLMAGVVKEAFSRLNRSDYEPIYPVIEAIDPTDDAAPQSSESAIEVSLQDLISAGMLTPGDVLTPARTSVEVLGEIDERGNIVVNDVPHSSPSSAAMAAAGTQSENGWTFWIAETSGGEKRLSELRDQYRLTDTTLAG